MREDYKVDTGSYEKTEDFYTIEEYQIKWVRWMGIGDDYYLPEYKHNLLGPNGNCWQETGSYGSYDEQYVRDYCNKLNEALVNGVIPRTKGIEKFRVVHYHNTYKKTVLEPTKY